MDITPYKKAVALRYDRDKDHAPRVIAKGRGYLAEQILSRAGEDTLVWEDPALVEALFQLQVDQEIPPHLYQVVAEVFAFVYRLDQQERER